MSVDSNGNTSFFATLEKASDNQTKLMEKKAKAKKEAKLKEKKATEKREKEERLERAKEKSKAQKEEITDRLNSDEEDIPVNDDKEYVDINASSIDDLLSKVSDYAISSSLDNVMTASEKAVGQHFDFKG
jgi:F0F1-type ATP synthase membrane subunit b/b'